MGRERDCLFQRAYIKILAFFKLLLFFLWIFLVLVCSDELRLNDLYFFRGKKKKLGASLVAQLVKNLPAMQDTKV